jgi:hypothetical protein
LTSIDLSSNSLTGGYPYNDLSGITAICEMLKVNAVLKNLNVAYNSSYNGESAQQLAAAALGSASLEVLSEVPIKELREDKHTSLNLSSKGLGPAEGIVLAKLMKFSAVLTDLNIAVNNIGPGGAKAFADALRVNAALTTLNLYGNSIGLEGGKALAEALRVNAVLTNLSVAHDPSISGEAAQQLAAAATRQQPSKSLKVLSEVPIQELREDRHTSLDLSYNGLGATEGIVPAELTKVSADDQPEFGR